VSEEIIVYCACGSEGEAEEIAAELVTQHLAACVNVSAPVRSIYRWQGKVESAAEWVLSIKTTKARFAEIASAVESLHSYELPEIVALPIVAGSVSYLKWLNESVHE
jgi:periplasmic divalent cation tolerance protein